MKYAVPLALCVALTASPGNAEQSEPRMGEGLGMMERGAQMFLRGLVEEIEPKLNEMAREIEPAMRDLMQNMEPMFAELARLMGSLDRFHAPEVLPNGDILLRRKTPLGPHAMPAPQSETSPAPQIDL